MRARRLSNSVDFQRLSLDGCDLAIWSRLAEPQGIVEVGLDLPCAFPEAMERLRRLVQLELVELLVDDDASDDDGPASAFVPNLPSTNERDDPPTGVHLKALADRPARARALLGACVIGRMKRRERYVERPVSDTALGKQFRR